MFLYICKHIYKHIAYCVYGVWIAPDHEIDEDRDGYWIRTESSVVRRMHPSRWHAFMICSVGGFALVKNA